MTNNKNRNRGYYFVKFHGLWEIARWTGSSWEFDLSIMIDSDFDEIGSDPIPMPGAEHETLSLPELPEIALPKHADTPDAEHRFFVYCPENCKFFYFKTTAERDLYADKGVIEDFLDDGWHDGVERVVCGEVTHTCVKVSLTESPTPDGSYDFEMQELQGEGADKVTQS